MKNRIAFFMILLITSSTSGQTSIYHPFPDSNVVWNVEGSSPCSVGFSYRQWLSYVIENDTVIGPYTYHSVYIAFTINLDECQNLTWTYGSSYSGAIRQDTAAKTVYYYAAYDTAEQLLYNFNLHIGDTLPGNPLSSSTGCPNAVVIDEDSVYINGNYRKRWHMDFLWGPDYLIEGIGFTGGPFEPVCYWFEGGPVLVCCTQDNVILFQDSLYTTTPGLCDILNSTGQIESRQNVVFYPNPLLSTGYFITHDYPCIISIYNMLGEKIQELKCASEKTIFNREGYVSGLYFYLVTNQNELKATGKIIVE